MTDILSAMARGWSLGQQMSDARQRKTLASLFQQAYNAPKDQRQQYIGQAMGIDPGAAMEMDQGLSGIDERSTNELVQAARLLDSLPNEQRPAAYAALKPRLASAVPGMQLPEQYDEQVAQTARAIVQAWGGGKAPEPRVLSPGSALVADNGQVIYERPFAPANAQLVEVPTGDGGTMQMIWDARTRQFQVPQYEPGQEAAPAIMGDALRDAVEQVESGGNPYAVSPKGAVGPMQTMPGTLADPGFGVQPARDNSVDEQRRVGNDYLKAMMQRYGDPRLALAAYNWGPGNVDRTIQRVGRDPDAVLGAAPQETRQYVPRVLGRLGYRPPKPPEPSTVQRRQQMIAELEAIGVSLSPAEREAILTTGKPPDARPGQKGLSAGEAAKVRTNLKETRDALNAFMAFDNALKEIPNGPGLLFDGKAKGRLGTAYNNARAAIRILYNTGVLQPGELPMLETALRDPNSPAAVLDPRTRPQLRAQLDELYRLTDQNIRNLVESYPQIFDQQTFERARQEKLGGPKVGEVQDGYRFKGGDPADPNSWEKV